MMSDFAVAMSAFIHSYQTTQMSPKTMKTLLRRAGSDGLQSGDSERKNCCNPSKMVVYPFCHQFHHSQQYTSELQH